MINSSDFAKRLQEIMDHYHLTGASFAESIGVQRSAISHILSGRNKPSLDFVLKILDAYPDIELYWLLNGKGSGPFKEKADAREDLFSNAGSAVADPHPPGKVSSGDIPPVSQLSVTKEKKVSKVVIFYSDNTYEEIRSDEHL